MSNPRRRWSRSGPKTTRRLRGVAVLPSLFTLGNAICGFAAIYYAAMPPESGSHPRFFISPLVLAGYLILIGILADAIDGRLARLSNTASNFGAQLDSLADMVSFGVAPAFLMIKLVSQTPASSATEATIAGKLVWLIAVIYMCCTALRLARFNVESTADISSHHGFKGLPCPAAAGTIASLVVLHQEFRGYATGLGNLHVEQTKDQKEGQTDQVLEAASASRVVVEQMNVRYPRNHSQGQYQSDHGQGSDHHPRRHIHPNAIP